MAVTRSPGPSRRAKELVRLFASRCCRAALQFTSRPYQPEAGVTIVFAPHQDDETLGCGAMIARKRTAGLPVHVVFLTDGAASHPNHPLVPPAAIAAIRSQEARNVLAVLGVDSRAIHFLNEPDGTLARISPARRELLVARIAGLIHRLGPDEIFLPCRAEGSSEHEAAFSFVLAAIECGHTAATIWEYPVWLWWNPIAQLKRLALAGDRRRAVAEDYLPIKRRALAHYRSQLESLLPQPEPALPLNLRRLLDNSSEYFFRVAPQFDHLRLSGAPVI
jgi:LmbE family N-acetylglucosaminyl deacetylase